MEFHFFWPLVWIGFGMFGMTLSHRRRMERMRLGLPDRREEKARRWREWGEGMRDRYQQPLPQPAPELPSADRRELEDLRERVKVLERIATEDRKTHDLAQEIEALRDR